MAESSPIKETLRVVSVDKMIEENKSAIITSDYQKLLRKRMKEAQGRF